MSRNKTITTVLVIFGIIITVSFIISESQYAGNTPTLLAYFQISKNPPLTRPESITYEDWVNQWKAKLPVSASIEDSLRSQYIGMTSTTYRIYTAHFEMQNQTSYQIDTGNNLYIIETARKPPPGEETEKDLRVAGGYFRKTPFENYSGVVEFRGNGLSEDETFGLLNWHSRSTNGGIFRRLGSLFEFTTGVSVDTLRLSFGNTLPDNTLIIDTELQLGVMVISDKLEKVLVLSPELRIHNKNGESVKFRYILGFVQAPQEKGKPEERQWVLAEKLLLPLTAEALLPLVKEKDGPLWRRVFTAHWAGMYYSELAAPALLSILSAKGYENDALRAAAILALAAGKQAAALQHIMAVVEDNSESYATRDAAINALGKFGDKRATPLLLSIADGKDENETKQAITSLGQIGDKAAVDPLLDILENNRLKDYHSNAASAIGKLADNSYLEKLHRISKNPGAKGAINAVSAIGGVGTSEALTILVKLSLSGADDVRKASCNALAKIDSVLALDALKRALFDKNKDVRYAAISGIASSNNAQRVAALREALKNPHENVQERAIRALDEQEVAHESMGILVKLTLSGTEDVRKASCNALAKIDSVLALDALKKALLDKNQSVRYAAINGINASKSSERVAALREALYNPHADVQKSAIRALAEQDVAHESLGILVKLSLSGADDVRKASCNALAKIDSVLALDALKRALFDKNKDVRYAAISGIASSNNAQRVAALREALKNPHENVQERAIRALDEKDVAHESLGILVKLSLSGTDDVRKASCNALAKIDSVLALKALKRALVDKNQYVRYAAINGISASKSSERVAALKEALHNPHANVQKSAIRALADQGVAEAKLEIVSLFNDRNTEVSVREVAANALKSFPGEETEQVLINAVKNPVADVRRAAIKVLEELKVKNALPIITQALLDKEANVRSTAARALVKIGDESIFPALLHALLEEKERNVLDAQASTLIDLGFKDLSVFPEILARLRDLNSRERYPLQRLLKHLSGKDFSPKYNAKRKEVEESINKWMEWWKGATMDKKSENDI